MTNSATAEDTAAFVARMLEDALEPSPPPDTTPSLEDAERADADSAEGDPAESAVRPIVSRAAADAAAEVTPEPVVVAPVAEPVPAAAPSDTVFEQTPFALVDPEAVLRASMPAPPISAPLTIDDDAYFHPGGQIHAMTLHGFRYEPPVTARTRAREGRKSENPWLVLGLVALAAPLLFVAAIVLVGKLVPGPATSRTARLHAATPEKTEIALLGASEHVVRVSAPARARSRRSGGRRGH